MDQKTFIKNLRSWQNGSISRRDFLGRTGLGVAAAVVASNMPGLLMSSAQAGEQKLSSDRLALATWPNYHSQENLDDFGKTSGARVSMSVFGSNEEMLAKLQAGGSGWDVLVPTNYTISTYVGLGLIEPLDLARLPNFDASAFQQKFMAQGTVDGKVYAVPKNWGTTGMLYDSEKLKDGPASWKAFWAAAQGPASGRTMVHDYQLTAIGNALKSFGYSFNSLDPKELADAEKLLIEVKPHLFAINSDIQPSMRSGDAWLAMSWTGDASQLHRDLPQMQYELGKEGGELWSDFFAIPKSSEHKDAAYAFINYLLDPQHNKLEVLSHGYPSGDKRVDALLPVALLEDPIMYPAAEALSPLEFGAAATLTSPARAELMARFKSA
ncbi:MULTISPECIES: ABC transporter substrate-binding protein [Pseudomonas]|jgi:spermidine/putrescine transport system substrate-binding protein|uniref:ABC transporter substrate-binding protein n=1 Tax=Pseudomonas TaxID=286 RepID=UPI00028805C0|nr:MULTISPECIES: extracellular solute-binding protein [Pseudomonas]AMB80147.1 potassium transporter Trk [Pseudomonas fragi]MCB1653900.1 extracellular solute-binding protein [Pseudomonadales bacterium]AUB75862.1 potassium transporter Trk [Pseudomonas sp. Lz4W]MCH4870737.1 spermidine/putrescine ABC transporter substrate-binding protein [Pseudomonas sp. TMW22089]NBG93055.1 spermidine/putrescine ABC transporter substrate-binding protein [Pseudomonas sp. 9.1(2019)]